MRRLTLGMLILTLAACGDPIGGAANCTDLYQATLEAVDALPDSNIAAMPEDQKAEALEAFDTASEELRQKVSLKADELVGPAIARGAEAEAAICLQAVEETFVIAQVFDSIAP